MPAQSRMALDPDADGDRRAGRPARAAGRISQARRTFRQVARDLQSRRSRSWNSINANAHALARYAALCQENGIVPIVEPEVLMDYDNDIDTCGAITEWVLKEVFQELYYAQVKLEGIVLKPNMVISRHEVRQAGERGGSRRQDGDGPEALRAVGGAGHRVPLRRSIRRDGNRASVRDERAPRRCPGR